MFPSKVKLVVSLVFLVATLSVIFFFSGYSKNNLYHHPQWVSAKSLRGLFLNGSTQTVFTRNLLAKNRLNLGAWHGYQEVALKKMMSPKKISFDFYLPWKSRLLFKYNATEKGFVGLNLTDSTLSPSFFFKGKNGEGYQNKKFLNRPLSEGWHHLELENKSFATTLLIDGEPIKNQVPAIEQNSYISFKGDYFNVIVDNLKLKSDKETFVENFAFHEWNPRQFAIALLVSFILQCLFLYFGRRSKTQFIVYNLTALTFVSWVYLVDYHRWSHLYPYDDFVPRNQQASSMMIKVENFRRSLFDQAYDRLSYREKKYLELPTHFISSFTSWQGSSRKPYINRVLETSSETSEIKIVSIPDFAPPSSEKGVFRIGLLGTSQTAGTGADSLQHSLTQYLYQFIQSETEMNVEVYNFSLPGGAAKDMIEIASSKIQSPWLNVLVLNFVVNDTGNPHYEENMRRLLSITKAAKVPTVILVEGVSTTAIDPWLQPNWDVLEKLSQEGYMVWDLNSYLKRRTHEGDLWWDFVHLTSFGQEIAGRWLAQKINSSILLKPH